jgi:hypothetical protein
LGHWQLYAGHRALNVCPPLQLRCINARTARRRSTVGTPHIVCWRVLLVFLRVLAVLPTRQVTAID